MVLFEHLQPLLQNRELAARGEGDAGAEAFAALAAAGDQGDGADAVVEELAQQLVAGHTRVGHREVETVGQRLVAVLVIDDDEAVVGEEFLHDGGFLAVLLHVVDIVVGAVVAGLEDGGHRVLRGVGHAGADGIHGAVDDGASELGVVEVGHKVGELAVVHLVGEDEQGDALAGVAEGLGAGDHQRVIVGVFADGGLEGRHTGRGDVVTEVHTEIGEVFEHEHIVLVGEFADDLEFLFGKADPGGVVGVGVDDGVDVSLLEVAFQFGAQFLAAVLIHVEGLIFEAEHAVLLFLDREARVDEERRVAFLAGAHEGHKGGHAGHHGAHGGDAVLGVHFQVDEVLDEAGGLPFDVGNALNVGVDGGNAVFQGLDLCFHAYVAGGQAGNAHLHADELHAGGLFDFVDQTFYLADGGFSYGCKTTVGDDFIDDFSGNGCVFHYNVLICCDITYVIVLPQRYKKKGNHTVALFRYGKEMIIFSSCQS